MIDNKKINMFENAYNFYMASHKLNTNIEIEYPNISSLYFNTIIVNLSLACELFLKTLLFDDAKELKSHHLNKLFNMSNTNDQKIIKSIIIIDYSLTYSKSINKNLIQKRLKGVSNYFKVLRYFYEYDINKKERDLDYTGCCFIKKFCDALIILLLKKLDIEIDETHKPIITNENKFIQLMELTND